MRPTKLKLQYSEYCYGPRKQCDSDRDSDRLKVKGKGSSLFILPLLPRRRASVAIKYHTSPSPAAVPCLQWLSGSIRKAHGTILAYSIISAYNNKILLF